MVVANSVELGLQRISLDFESHVVWELEALVMDIVGWLNHSTISNTSQVGILASPQFLDLISPSIGTNTGACFQRMIYAITLAHTRKHAPDRHCQGSFELNQIGSSAGHQLLKILDAELKP
jgi:hypothetical protein